MKCARDGETKKVGLDDFVHVCNENIKVTKSFIYLGLPRKSLDGLAWILALGTYFYLSRVSGFVNIHGDKKFKFVTCAPCQLYVCKTRRLNNDLERDVLCNWYKSLPSQDEGVTC